MSTREFEQWKRFYRQAPFDDLHRYHRPAALAANAMGGIDIGKAIDMLVNDAQRVEEMEHVVEGEFSEADKRTFAALGMRLPGV